MALTSEDYAVFTKHFERFKLPRCPICGHNHWDASGIEAGSSVDTAAMALDGGPVMPTVLVTCTRCFYVMHFAWGPLRDSVVSR